MCWTHVSTLCALPHLNFSMSSVISWCWADGTHKLCSVAMPGRMGALKTRKVTYVVRNRHLLMTFEPDDLCIIKLMFMKSLKYMENVYNKLPKQQR